MKKKKNILDNWKKEARQKVFNKLAFIGDSGQEYVDKVVFPFIQKLLSAKEKEYQVKLKKAIIDSYATGNMDATAVGWMGSMKKGSPEVNEVQRRLNGLYKKYGVDKISKEKK